MRLAGAVVCSKRFRRYSSFPVGRAVAPEDEFCPFEVRQTILGQHRILFTVIESRTLVYILTVRHGARRFMRGNQVIETARDVLDDEMDEGEDDPN